MDISETIAASGLNFCRCRQLIQEMKVSIEGQCHFLTLAHGYLRIKMETCFSQKPLGHFQPNFICNVLGTRK